jgi:hypothetical protein
LSQKQRIKQIIDTLNKMAESIQLDRRQISRLADSVIVFSGALKVLEKKGLVNNEEIKQAIEEVIAQHRDGKPGVPGSGPGADGAKPGVSGDSGNGSPDGKQGDRPVDASNEVSTPPQRDPVAADSKSQTQAVSNIQAHYDNGQAV